MKTAGVKNRIIPAVFAFLCLLTACAAPQTPAPAPEAPPVQEAPTPEEEPLPPTEEASDEETPADRAKSLCAAMTAEEKVGQMFLVHWPGDNAAELAQRYHLGGYLLFADYFEPRPPEQVAQELAACQQAQQIPMLMAVDEEGGAVTRISCWPRYRQRPFASAQWLYANGGAERVAQDAKEKCELLRSLGINLNLAPVCDSSQDPNDYIYYRTLGRDHRETRGYVATVVAAMKGSGVGCTLKHFPGYGGNADTHTGMAVDDRPYEQFDLYDFSPFAGGIRAGAGSVMVSHNIINCMDPNNPASLSPGVHNVLRGNLAFDGVIITDDLTMEGIRQFAGEQEAAVLAVQAGNDLLCCSDFETQIPAVLEALEQGQIDMETVDAAVERILRWKIELGLME